MSDDLIAEFLVDSYESLEELDADLIELERNPHDAERCARAFRAIHNFKGTSGFLDFTQLVSLTHAGEQLLATTRDGRRAFDRSMASALLEMVAAIRRILVHIEATGYECREDSAHVVAELSRLNDSVMPAAAGTPGAAVAPAINWEERRSGADRRQSMTDHALRVHVKLLDSLSELVTELAIARDDIMRAATSSLDRALRNPADRLDGVTTELEALATMMRMQPIGNVWGRFPRLVRDLAGDCGKQVRVEMMGTDTLLDKSVIEALKDPLTHMIRNALDHGIERPEVRAERQKPIEGCIRLRASEDAGVLTIEISDDGAGIDPAQIRAAAIRSGALAVPEAERMNDDEAVRFMFRQGVSTANEVSLISGRGVGMDVVLTNIEKLGGTVDVRSRVGQGTVVSIAIPTVRNGSLVATAGHGHHLAPIALRSQG